MGEGIRVRWPLVMLYVSSFCVAKRGTNVQQVFEYVVGDRGIQPYRLCYTSFKRKSRGFYGNCIQFADFSVRD